MPKTTEESGRGYHLVVDLEGFDSDLAALEKTWCSETSKKGVSAKLKLLLKGNTDCFSRIDVRPLYRKGRYLYYRVIVYIRDYSWEGFMPTDRIWHDYYVEVDRKDCSISSTNPCIK